MKISLPLLCKVRTIDIPLFYPFNFRVTEELVQENDKNLSHEKPPGEEDLADGNKESPANEPEEKEPEDKVFEHWFSLKPRIFF